MGCEFTCSLLKPGICQVHARLPSCKTRHLAGQNVRPKRYCALRDHEGFRKEPARFLRERSGGSAACTPSMPRPREDDCSDQTTPSASCAIGRLSLTDTLQRTSFRKLRKRRSPCSLFLALGGSRQGSWRK